MHNEEQVWRSLAQNSAGVRELVSVLVEKGVLTASDAHRIQNAMLDAKVESLPTWYREDIKTPPQE